MRRYQIGRRKALQYVGLAATAGITGCLGSSGTPDSDSAQNGNQTEEQEGGQEGEHSENEAGHGEDENGHSDAESVPHEPAESATVQMVTTENGLHFEPHVVWIENGGTITWNNESGSHTATAYHPDNEDKPLRIPDDADPWDSGLLTEQGATFEHTFGVEGVYDYYCAPHEAKGMLGSVIVGEPEPHDQPALQPPRESLPRGARQKIGDLNHMVENGLGNRDEPMGHHG